MKDIQDTIYCSLDIETSGFDPLKNEILEVGLVFFTIDAARAKIRIIEEWTRVFKPKGEVPPQILTLTGITLAELETATDFADSKEELAEKLATAVIVGHNVQFDIKFLQGNGIVFSGKVIDTLDLVQFILPTHHSYNLENLSNLFAVEHKNAHRALADAKASLEVFENMMGVFSSMPAPVREQVSKLAHTQNFEYAHLLDMTWTGTSSVRKTIHTGHKPVAFNFNAEPGYVYDIPAGFDCLVSAATSLSVQKRKSILVVPKSAQVMQLWSRGVVTPVFSPQNVFDSKKFHEFLNRETLSADEAKFAMKVLVWQHTHWQAACVLDLNLSFFGGQFKQSITADKIPEPKSSGVLCCDFETFQYLAEQGLCKGRFPAVVGMNDFEQFVSTSLGVKVSWSYITYLLKSYYNPDLGTGNQKFADLVTEGLTRSDLFFGLVHALLASEGQIFEYKRINADSFQSENFQKIQMAAAHFIVEIRKYANELESTELVRYADNLEKFFLPDANTVQWVELAENRCILFSSPLSITASVHSLLENFKTATFIDGVHNPKLTEYLIERLGLSSFIFESLSGKPSIGPKQGDLLGLIAHKLGVGKRHTVRCHLRSQPLLGEELHAILQDSNLPAAVLLQSVSQVRDFQDAFHKSLKNKAFVLTQNGSGGSNKIFHNFSIHPDSLLLATGKFILKHQVGSTNVSPVEHLTVQTLVIGTLPFENFRHPYEEAVTAQLQNAFEEYSLPKAVYNLHVLLDFFYSPELSEVYICDSKLAKAYATTFIDYLHRVPGLEIVLE